MFDPYRKWLGILPKDQPPNHYRLLSLELFEHDLDVIEGAADRQMSFVRQYQSGENAADAAKILNELAVARLCLLKPATKAAYDAKLRKELAPPPAPEPDFPELPFTDADLKTERATRKPSKKKSGNTRGSGPPLPLMIGGGVAAVVCLAVVVFLFSGGTKPAERQNKVATTTPATSNVGEVKRTDNPRPRTTTNASSVSDGSWSEPKLIVEPAGDAIDLLKLVEFPRDVAAGDWKQTATALIGPSSSGLYLPVKPPEDYQLKFAVRRIEGADTLILGFMMAGRQGMIALDIGGAVLSGLYVDGLEPHENRTTRKGRLFKDQTATIVLTVHPGHLHATFDGQTIIDWHGDPERLYLHSGHGLPSRESPFIGISQAKYVVESASLIPIKPERPHPRPARLDRDIDVPPLVDLDRDGQRGIWAISKNTISSPDGEGRIYLPTVVPEEYTVSATVELPPQHQGDYALTMGLVADKSYFQFTSTGSDTGLDMIDGRRWNANETRLAGPLLKPGIPTRIDCTVTKGGIRIEGGGKTLVDWRGDLRRLAIPSDWALPDARRLFLGSTHHLKFRDIKVGPPISPPKLPDHPPLSVGKPIDLLAVIDPARDAIGGIWERDGTSLRYRGDLDGNKLVIPFEVPDEYRLTVRVSRMEGGKSNNEALTIGLPIGQGKAICFVDSWKSTLTAIYSETGIGNGKQIGSVIPPGVSREIVYVVRKTGVQLSSEGSTIIDWTINPEAFAVAFALGTPGRRIALMSSSSDFRFEKIELESLLATSFPEVSALGADGKLLPIMNVGRDARKGDWKLDDNGLACPNIPYSRVRIPAPVPKQYVFSATVERKQGNADLFVGLLVGGNPCAVSIDGDTGHQAGIDLLDGKTFSEAGNLTNRKYKDPLLPVNKSVPIRCVVLPNTIVVSCGDEEVIRWHGDPRRLSAKTALLPPNYSESDRSHLWLGVWYSEFVFRDLELKPLTDAEAEELSTSFSGVFPTTSQSDVPLASIETKAVVPENSPPVQTPPGSTPSVSTASQPAKPGDWVDLLEWAEGVDWAPRGINWNDNIEGKPTREGIRIKQSPVMRFPLTAIIDGNYEMEVEFKRNDGVEAVAVYFPVGIHTMRLLLGADTGTVSHVAYIDGKEFGQQRPSPITNNQTHRVVIRVRHDEDKAAFNIDLDNAKDYIKWEGAHTALKNDDQSAWSTNMIQRPWIGGWNSNVVFQKVRVRMLSGSIHRDFLTDADRKQDLKNGFVRLVGEEAKATRVGFGQFVVNQFPLELPGQIENGWPLITRDFKVCDDFYSAHTPSRIKCAIPKGAKSFSGIGYNDQGSRSKYAVWIDGKPIYDSGIAGIVVVKVDIPAKSSLLELITEKAGSSGSPTTYWCYPRFHSVIAEKVKDKMLDGDPGPLTCTVASGTAGYGGVGHNESIPWVQSIPINFRDALPCNEFLFAHASSTVSYRVPEGMTRFTAIAYNVIRHSVNYEVWADAKRIYESPRVGIIPIDVKLTPGTKTIELKINDMDGTGGDHSMWCYPRLHRK